MNRVKREEFDSLVASIGLRYDLFLERFESVGDPKSGSLAFEIKELREELRAINKKMDHLLDHLGLEYTYKRSCVEIKKKKKVKE